MSGMMTMMRVRKTMQAWQDHFDSLAPRPGDVAPNFELRDANGENPVRLSDFRRRKPVVLNFGSFT